MNSLLKDKSYAFAIRIVKLSPHVQMNKKEFVLSKQIFKKRNFNRSIDWRS